MSDREVSVMGQNFQTNQTRDQTLAPSATSKTSPPTQTVNKSQEAASGTPNKEPDTNKVAAATRNIGTETNAPSVSSATIYVGDLHPEVNEANLFEVFSAIGPVASVRVCRDIVTRRSLGYAYVNFHSMDDAERALETMNFYACPQTRDKPMRLMWKNRDPTIRKSGAGNVFIKNLDKAIDNKTLFDTFSVFGNILSCKVATDDEGNSLGYGFVHFENPEDAETAINKVNGMLLNDKQVYVGYFKSRQEREASEETHIFTNVYTKNLIPSMCTEEKIRELFSLYGEITSVYVPVDENEVPKGFAFVNFAKPECAAKAVEELNGRDFEGKSLYVGRAQKKAEREAELRRKAENKRAEILKKYQGVNLYVRNLPDDMDEEGLRKEFSNFGTLTSCRVMRDDKGVSRGFGFVCFSTPEEATKAVTEMNGKMMGKKPLYVCLAQRKEIRQAQLEAQRIAAAAGGLRIPGAVPGSLYPQPGAPMFYPQPGVPPQMQLQTNMMGRGQASFINPQYLAMMGRGAAAAAGTSSGGAGMGSGPVNQNFIGRGTPVMTSPTGGRAPYPSASGVGTNAVPQVGASPPYMPYSVSSMPQNQRQRNYQGSVTNPNSMLSQNGMQSTSGRMQPNNSMMGRGGRGGASAPNAAGMTPNNMPMQLNGQQFKYTMNARNAAPVMNQERVNPEDMSQEQRQQQQARQADNATSSASLIALLTNASPEQQKQILGERLYPLIYERQPGLAGKITGMLLEMDNSEVLHLIESPDALSEKIEEALAVLRAHAEQQKGSTQAATGTT
ncbi:poly(A) binding / translation initiation factor [Galdieria sulphuraria]|uniref:Polyadenylate-binding protein n=1 Tax=Galdieria sulphuraria TaxID=130081 RepID=M2XW36_GALSU|nr:poly(A) binding / translation initiation factor [Galdieria sulphuraria]EME27649.1 poly(A) binding / translation initiation factor [Galdieria sulphuraria]|eukprot:XP_005704169.1 poly(A) binding / translation initiation factor [Galdieria sulphuraria]